MKAASSVSAESSADRARQDSDVPAPTRRQGRRRGQRRSFLLRKRRARRWESLDAGSPDGPVVRLGRRRDTFRSGAASSLRLLLAPLGRHAARFHRSVAGADRLENGLIVLLPGIDGCTTVCDNIARGLYAVDQPAALEIHDWRSFPGWNPFHLTTARKNRQQAARICQRIRSYQQQYPDRPVHLVGHSAGAGMALFVLEELNENLMQVTTATLLAAAISRRFDVEPLIRATTRGIWNFWSRGDLPTVGLGTLIFGTMDRRHSVSAGALGFARQTDAEDASATIHDVAYKLAMARCWNFGGHFGCTNTAFVSRYVAPILAGDVQSAAQLHQRRSAAPANAK